MDFIVGEPMSRHMKRFLSPVCGFVLTRSPIVPFVFVRSVNLLRSLVPAVFTQIVGNCLLAVLQRAGKRRLADIISRVYLRFVL